MRESRKVAPMSSSSEIESAPKNYFNLPLTILFLAGMCPINSNHNSLLRFLFSIYFWLVYIFIAVLNTVSKAIALPNQTNLDDFTDNVSFVINHAIAVFKIALFMIKRNDLMRLVGIMEGEKFRHKDCSMNFSANRLVRNTVKTSQKVYCFFICCLIGMISNSSLNAITKRSDREIKIIFDSNTTEFVENIPKSDRALPFHGWYPFSIRISPNYELVFAYQIIAVFIVGLIVLALDNLVFSFMMHIKVQFQILSHNLRFIKSHAENERKKFSASTREVSHRILEETENYITERIELDLEKHIAHHRAIIQVAGDLESVFTYQLIVQFICSLLAICMLMWQVSSTTVLSARFVSMLSHLLAVAFQLFMYCWFGNELMLESLSVAKAAWDSEWYETLSQRNCYGIAMIIHRSQKVIMITAGGFFDLTLETFMTISQAAYSCLALLKKMNV